MGIQSHRDLTVWQKAMDLAVLVYQLARLFPREEVFGLRAQVTRAAASVPANIAEGSARASTKEYLHFLAIARGSLAEVETFLLLAARLEYFSQADTRDALDLIEEVGKMLTTLRQRLR